MSNTLRGQDIINLGDDTLRDAHISVPEDDESSVVFAHTETLDFHRGHMDEDWARLVDEDGYLTDQTIKQMEAVLSEESNGVSVDIYQEDEGYFYVEIALPGVTLDTDQQTAELAAWTPLASVINLTDPGSFGHVYLFNEVLRRLDA